MRSAEIRKSIRGDSLRGPDTEWVVYLYEDNNLVEKRRLGIHNRYYAEDVRENWLNGIIKPTVN